MKAVAVSLRLCYSVLARIGVGGMGRGMGASIRAAAAEKWDVRAICAPGGGHPDGVELVEVDASRALRLARLTPARFSPAWMRWAAEKAHDLKARPMIGSPDVFQGAGHCCLASLRAAKSAGAVTVLESMNAHARHVDRVMRQEEKAAGSSAHFHNSTTVRRCEAEYDAADFIYCNSSYTRRTLLEEGVPEDKVIVVPLGVDLPEKTADHSKDGRFRALFVGMLDLRKGFRHLLAAWERLALTDAELYLRGGTGDRPCRRILESWRQKMAFTVDLEYGRVPYEEFSVLVLPSVSDGFGLVVPEAMAAGLPVIVTENVGAADLVREGIDGFVVPVADADALAERIGALHRDRGRLAEMGRATRERVGEYSTGNFRRRYVAEISRIARE